MVDGLTGGTRTFTGSSGTYANPANDQGVFVKNMGGDFTYTDKFQTRRTSIAVGRRPARSMRMG